MLNPAIVEAEMLIRFNKSLSEGIEAESELLIAIACIEQ
jgi:hypothetical protein